MQQAELVNIQLRKAESYSLRFQHVLHRVFLKFKAEEKSIPGLHSTSCQSFTSKAAYPQYHCKMIGNQKALTPGE
jgi:hypothetical protein